MMEEVIIIRSHRTPVGLVIVSLVILKSKREQTCFKNIMTVRQYNLRAAKRAFQHPWIHRVSIWIRF